MGILTRHIAGEFIKFFCLFLIGLSLIILVGNLFSRLGDAMASVSDFIQFCKETLILLPSLFELVLPITALLATIATFSALSRTSEITAMRAAGMGGRHLILAVFWPSLLVAVASYFNQNYLNTFLKERWGSSQEQALPSLWKTKDQAFYYFGPRTQDGVVTTVVRLQWAEQPYLLEHHTIAASGERTEEGWDVRNLVQRSFQNQLLFEQYDASLIPQEDWPNLAFQREPSPHEQPLFVLWQTIQVLQEEGQDVGKHWVEFHQKFANPASIFIMVLIGLALSVSHSRKSRAAENIIICLFLIIFFWISQQIFLAIGFAGAIAPFFAAWSANLIFLAVGLLLVYLYRV